MSLRAAVGHAITVEGRVSVSSPQYIPCPLLSCCSVLMFVFLFSLIMYLTLGRVKAIFSIRITFILPFFQVKFMSISIEELVREAANAG